MSEISGRKVLKFDMGVSKSGAPRYNEDYDCIYAAYKEGYSGTLGIDNIGISISDLPEGLSLEEVLNTMDGFEKVEFHGKTWWHLINHDGTIRFDGQMINTTTYNNDGQNNYYETYLLPTKEKIARLQAVVDNDEKRDSNMQLLLGAVSTL